MEITYSHIPEKLKTIIRPAIEEVEFLFPTWCHKVHVSYNPGHHSDASLTCVADHAYRTVEITFYHQFFVDNLGRKEIVHEVCHALFAPYTEKVAVILQYFVQDEGLRQYMAAELTSLEEGIAQDLSRNIDMMLDNPFTFEYTKKV